MYQSEGAAPGGAVEVAVADGFAHVVGEYFSGVVEIGYRAGHFEDTVVGAGRHVKAVHRFAQDGHRLIVEARVLAKQSRVHLCITMDVRL